MSVFNIIKDKYSIFEYLASKGFFKNMSDDKYISYIYKARMKKNINLKEPQTFTEKLQWLKLYNRKDIYTTMVDKYEVKKYVADIIGEKYIIPTLEVYDKWEQIDFEKLPNQFVIKCTHDSGGLVIVRDKSKLNIKEAKKKINKSLKINYFYRGREWPYKNVKPRIIVEKYMSDNKQKDLMDFKFFCINGKVEFLYVSEGLSNHKTAKISFVDKEYKKIIFNRKDYKSFEHLPEKPINFEKMKELATILSKNIPFVRVDFYEINNKIYFGELTFFPCAGYIPFEPEEYDKILGDMLELPTEKREEK